MVDIFLHRLIALLSLFSFCVFSTIESQQNQQQELKQRKSNKNFFLNKPLDLDKDLLFRAEKSIKKRNLKGGLMGPQGPAGPQGPQGLTGLPGPQGEAFSFTKDEKGELNFKISLFQVGAPQLGLIQAIPYVVSPSGLISKGMAITINTSNISINSFIDLFSSRNGGKPIKIKSPEFGVYQIGVLILLQIDSPKIFNINISANVIATRGEDSLSTITQVLPSGVQAVLKDQSTELQLHAIYVYGPREYGIP